MTKVITRLDRFIETAKSVKLSAHETYAIRERLIAVMESEGNSVLPKSTPATPSNMPPIAFLIALAAFGAGGISIAAESALPGALLYPVKIAINEKLRFSLAKTPQQKIAAAAVILNSRLVEAEKLANNGELTSDVAATLNREVQIILAGVAIPLNEIELQNDAHATLQAHEEVDSVRRVHAHMLGTLSAAGKTRMESANAVGVGTRDSAFQDVATSTPSRGTLSIQSKNSKKGEISR